MLDQLPIDLILMILYKITNINNVINVSMVNKNMWELLDNNIYIYWGRNLYSNEFWNRANKRSSIISKPLINMKMELLRIENFQNCQKRFGYPLWNNEDYYIYWETMENYIKYH